MTMRRASREKAGEPVRRRIPAAERRALILREAGRLFAQHGYAGTRLEDIATAAQVTKPIVYRHFESKKALYVALLVKHRDDLPTFVEGGEPVGAILAVRRDVNPRAREVLASFLAERAGDSLPAGQVEPTAELLSSGLAGLALWWIDHPDTPMDVVAAVA